jgi:hypothetical protein
MNYALVNSWTSADGVGCFDIGELVTTYGARAKMSSASVTVRDVQLPRSELSLARRSSSPARSARRRLISRLTRVSSARVCCSLT